ncbi:MAG: hypothetical protein K0S41_2058 [Anaerocolumna sp.]|jgi:hypothetical protein|nr:hypothetical protein [Anaerocolumna sp.]
MAKCIVRLDNVAFTKNPALIKSAKYYVSTTATAIQNGMMVAIGDLVTGEREIHKVATPAVDTTYFGIVCTPEVMYDEKKHMDEFENAADAVLRVGVFQNGDIFSATVEAFDATPTVGKIVELAAANTMKVVATLTSGSTKVGKVVAVETVGAKTFYVVEVQ